VTLPESRTGEIAFTVYNSSEATIAGRAQIGVETAPGAAEPGWFTISGEAERTFPPDAAEHFTVRIAVPPTVPPGSYVFRLDMVGVANPDEDFVAGPSATVVVPAAVERKAPFPWWILAVVGGVLLVVIIAAAIFFLRDDDEPPAQVVVPNVIGLNSEEATAQLEAACDPEPCFTVEIEQVPGPFVNLGRIVSSNPPPLTPAEPGSTVVINVVVLIGFPIFPTPTP
jgi:serine/threonine-protein kinase